MKVTLILYIIQAQYWSPGGYDEGGKMRTDWNIYFEIYCRSKDLPTKVRLDVYKNREQL